MAGERAMLERHHYLLLGWTICCINSIRITTRFNHFHDPREDGLFLFLTNRLPEVLLMLAGLALTPVE